MDIKVYNSEKFERNTWWYIIFAVLFASIFILSLLNENFVGAVLLFFLLGAYFYYSVTNNQLVTMKIDKGTLIVWDKVYSWTSLAGYVIELDPKTQLIKNLVIITRNSHTIYTLNDDNEKIRDFIVALDQEVGMLDQYSQTFLEKMARRFKL